MRTIIGGNDKLACDLLRWFAEGEYRDDLVGIIGENRDKVAENKGWEKPFFEYGKKVADNLKIPYFEGDINAHVNSFEELQPDVISPCRTHALVKKPVLDVPTYGVTNLHNGMLPRYGGVAVVSWAILRAENEIGVTMHYMGEEFDEGKIIEQRAVDLRGPRRRLILPSGKPIEVNGKTSYEVYNEANSLSVDIYTDNYPLIREGKINPQPMDLSKKLYFVKGELDYEKDRYINLRRANPVEIAKHVRAFTFPPIQLPIGNYKGETIELKLEDLK